MSGAEGTRTPRAQIRSGDDETSANLGGSVIMAGDRKRCHNGVVVPSATAGDEVEIESDSSDGNTNTNTNSKVMAVVSSDDESNGSKVVSATSTSESDPSRKSFWSCAHAVTATGIIIHFTAVAFYPLTMHAATGGAKTVPWSVSLILIAVASAGVVVGLFGALCEWAMDCGKCSANSEESPDSSAESNVTKISGRKGQKDEDNKAAAHNEQIKAGGGGTTAGETATITTSASFPTLADSGSGTSTNDEVSHSDVDFSGSGDGAAFAGSGGGPNGESSGRQNKVSGAASATDTASISDIVVQVVEGGKPRKGQEESNGMKTRGETNDCARFGHVADLIPASLRTVLKRRFKHWELQYIPGCLQSLGYLACAAAVTRIDGGTYNTTSQGKLLFSALLGSLLLRKEFTSLQWMILWGITMTVFCFVAGVREVDDSEVDGNGDDPDQQTDDDTADSGKVSMGERTLGIVLVTIGHGLYAICAVAFEIIDRWQKRKEELEAEAEKRKLLGGKDGVSNEADNGAPVLEQVLPMLPKKNNVSEKQRASQLPPEPDSATAFFGRHCLALLGGPLFVLAFVEPYIMGAGTTVVGPQHGLSKYLSPLWSRVELDEPKAGTDVESGFAGSPLAFWVIVLQTMAYWIAGTRTMRAIGATNVYTYLSMTSLPLHLIEVFILKEVVLSISGLLAAVSVIIQARSYAETRFMEARAESEAANAEEEAAAEAAAAEEAAAEEATAAAKRKERAASTTDDDGL